MSSVDDGWRDTLENGLNNNFLFDCAKGKTAFAWGAAFVIKALDENFTKDELHRVWDEFRDFSAAYMGQSDTNPQ